MKVFQIDDELYAANDAAEAAATFREMTGDVPDDEPRELTDAELDAPQPEYGEDEQPTGGTTSVRQMLADHGDEAGWLAGLPY